MIIPNFSRHLQALGRGLEGNPIATFNVELRTVQCRFVPDDYPVVGSVQVDDVERPGGGKLQALALADREEFDAFVMAENLALLIDDFAFVFFDEFGLG